MKKLSRQEFMRQSSALGAIMIAPFGLADLNLLLRANLPYIRHD